MNTIHYTLIVTAILIAGALTGCDTGDSRRGGADDSPGGKADDLDDDSGDSGGAEVDTEHRATVQRCEALADRGREHTSELRVEKLATIETSRQSCLTEANDAVVARIEEALAGGGSEREGTTRDVLAQARSTGQRLCNGLVEASDGALEKVGAVLEIRCTGQAELAVADLIDAHVDFGAAELFVPPERDLFGDCYTAYDDALEAAVDLDGQFDATQELTQCIRMQTRDLADGLADAILENYAGRDATEVPQQILRLFDAANDSADALCPIFADASQDRGEPNVKLQFADCQAVAATRVYGLVSLTVPAVAPSADPTDDPGDGTTSG